jgi:hypothetical protein
LYNESALEGAGFLDVEGVNSFASWVQGILRTPTGVAETDQIFVIAERVAANSIEFGGPGREPGGLVWKALFTAAFQVAKKKLSGLLVAGPGTISMSAA